MFNENSKEKYAVTDLSWFCKAFNAINSLFKNQPVDIKVLKEQLKTYIDQNLVRNIHDNGYKTNKYSLLNQIEAFIRYLDELNMIKIINNNTECISILALDTADPSKMVLVKNNLTKSIYFIILRNGNLIGRV